jgi:sugar/nucleoside kinase (ribokinase family)
MLLLNDGEARLLTGEHNLLRCAERILEWGPEYVAVKKGEHGALLVSRRGVFIVPAFPVARVTDPTGAGDAFAGAFLGALARARQVSDASVRRAMFRGSVVASFAVEGFSLDRLATLAKGDIRRRLLELKRMTRA